jgi:hypothetical protein
MYKSTYSKYTVLYVSYGILPGGEGPDLDMDKRSA